MTQRFHFDPETVALAGDADWTRDPWAADRPLHLEVGFGKDVRILREAELHPEEAYLGVEISRKKCASFCRKVARAGLSNVRAYHGDVRPVLAERLPDASVHSVTVLFPDPWPKRRHRKHRWIQGPTARHIARVLVVGGTAITATDDQDYADQIRACLLEAGLELTEDRKGVPDEDRSLFAQRFERLEVPVRHMRWRKSLA